MVSLRAFSPDSFETLLKKNDYYILDTRPHEEFTVGFVPDAINIALDGDFVHWASILIPSNTSLMLITPPGKEQDTVKLLEAANVDTIAGYLEGGFAAWQAAGKSYDMIIEVSADELALDMPFDDKLQIIDVRNAADYDAGHVAGAENLPLEKIIEPLQTAQLDDDGNMYLYSETGRSSVTACSFLKKEGFHNLRNVLDGYKAIQDTPNLPLEVPKKS